MQLDGDRRQLITEGETGSKGLEIVDSDNATSFLYEKTRMDGRRGAIVGPMSKSIITLVAALHSAWQKGIASMHDTL